jgi:hypothetical protein
MNAQRNLVVLSGNNPARRAITGAALDTGAYCTCIDPWICQALGLTAVNVVALATPGGSVQGSQRNLHEVSLAILNPSGNAADHLTRGRWDVAEIELTAVTGDDVVIGADLLVDGCLLVFDGQKGEFRLAY